MKTAISVYRDDSIGIISCSPRDIATLTGPGGEYSQEWADREIRVRTDAALGPVLPVTIVTEYALAMITGGLTEDQACDLLQRMSNATQETHGLVCKECHLVDEATIPAHDRYFRNAWEWSD